MGYRGFGVTSDGDNLMTYLQASATLKEGDRVRLTTAYGDYPMPAIPAGAIGTVTENGLNEMQPILFVKMDETFAHLRDWSNELQIDGPEHPYDPDDTNSPWLKPSPVELIQQ